MYLTPVQTAVTILAITLGTMLTRFLPFILFSENRKVSDTVVYLGRVLPPAMIGLLVVYCFKSVAFLSVPFGAPEIISIVAIIMLHKLKGNVMLSIAGGTILYMVLVQFVFI